MQTRDRQAALPSIKRRVKRIIWMLLVVCLIVFTLGTLQIQLMSGIRAYVRGEGLWAKSQKDAVLLLYRYLEHPSDELMHKFHQALRVNLADRRARLALQQEEPDREAAREGFLAGGNHPNDVRNMIDLFLYFGNVEHMRNAINIWRQADAQIDQLLQLANQIAAQHRQNPAADLGVYERQLNALDRTLNQFETEFSSELSRGARWIRQVLLWVNLGSISIILLFVGLVSRRVLQQIDNTESQLRDSQLRFKSLYEANVIGIIIWGQDGEIFDGNDYFLSILGYSRQELIDGQLNWRQLTPGDLADDERALAQINEQGYCLPFAKEFFHRDGHAIPVLVGGTMMDGSTHQGIAFVVDRSNEKKMEAQLRLSATVLEASRDGIIICDAQRRVLTANGSYLAMTGFSKAQLLGQEACFYHTTNPAEQTLIEQALNQQHHWQGDTELPCQDGTLLPVRASIGTVTNDAGQIAQYVSVFSDISARKAMEQKLLSMAHYDNLTGLANRSLFSDRLNTAILRAQRHHSHCALLFIDLDKFKPVNDQYGHAVGDELLQRVAQRLLEARRKNDTVGRLGGDEFVMIVEELSNADYAVSIADQVAKRMQEPFVVADHSVHIGCSIGIAVYPQDGDNEVDLTRAADIAMYAAKGKENASYYLYSGGKR
ncbi:sensor domain-containing diguanylate cyclase [Ketobacter sp.]|uniref:sensor domain-containing diguanylate cyclase n=1 Tax=Ketobacter sp. TaxID=2083498 RepID=UPI000F29D8EF|nr:sensor domain-containing diguanylate cyclase [Ketobacter sp.]RLT92084.1 MAG: diguanylate cyclase [Ketobacter sp.]